MFGRRKTAAWGGARPGAGRPQKPRPAPPAEPTVEQFVAMSASEQSKLPDELRLRLVHAVMDAHLAAFEHMRAQAREHDALVREWRERRDDPAWRSAVVEVLRLEEGERPELYDAVDPFYLADDTFPEGLANELCDLAWPSGWLATDDDENEEETT